MISMEFQKSDSTQAFEPARSQITQYKSQQNQSKPFQFNRIANGFQVTKYYCRFAILQKLYCIDLSIQLFLSFIYYEIQYRGTSELSFLILHLIQANQFLLILLSTLTHLSYNDLKTSQLKTEQTLDIIHLLLSWVVIILQPYSFLSTFYIENWNYRDNVYVQLKLNYLLVILSLLKLILIISCVLNLLKYKNPRASRVTKMYGLPNSKLYQIKCIFKTSPIVLSLTIVLFCILFFSFAFRISQRDQNDFFNLENSLWLVILTMTSVGFGDFFPITFLGRTFGILCTFCGTMTVSLIVLVIINTFQMDSSQDQALRLLKKLGYKKQIKRLAGQYIRISLWRLWKNKQLIKNGLGNLAGGQTREQRSIKNSLRQLIRCSKHQNQLSDKNLGQQMRRQFQKLSFNLQNINKNCDSIMGFLSNEYLINIDQMKDSKIGGVSMISLNK